MNSGLREGVLSTWSIEIGNCRTITKEVRYVHALEHVKFGGGNLSHVVPLDVLLKADHDEVMKSLLKHYDGDEEGTVSGDGLAHASISVVEETVAAVADEKRQTHVGTRAVAVAAVAAVAAAAASAVVRVVGVVSVVSAHVVRSGIQMCAQEVSDPLSLDLLAHHVRDHPLEQGRFLESASRHLLDKSGKVDHGRDLLYDKPDGALGVVCGTPVSPQHHEKGHALGDGSMENVADVAVAGLPVADENADVEDEQVSLHILNEHWRLSGDQKPLNGVLQGLSSSWLRLQILAAAVDAGNGTGLEVVAMAPKLDALAQGLEPQLRHNRAQIGQHVNGFGAPLHEHLDMVGLENDHALTQSQVWIMRNVSNELVFRRQVEDHPAQVQVLA
ncbi:hypothetical protein BGX27_005790 [Mortierella sp. AM989]|nr:hypothetical protein BGX27_005790 [Mortierella sp. AM989]